jgi:hypothetical protein
MLGSEGWVITSIWYCLQCIFIQSKMRNKRTKFGWRRSILRGKWRLFIISVYLGSNAFNTCWSNRYNPFSQLSRESGQDFLVRVDRSPVRLITGWITQKSKSNASTGYRKHVPCAVLGFPAQCHNAHFEDGSSKSVFSTSEYQVGIRHSHIWCWGWAKFRETPRPHWLSRERGNCTCLDCIQSMAQSAFI